MFLTAKKDSPTREKNEAAKIFLHDHRKKESSLMSEGSFKAEEERKTDEKQGENWTSISPGFRQQKRLGFLQ